MEKDFTGRYVRKETKMNLTQRIPRAILACIFSLLALWGSQINVMDSVSYFGHPFLFLILAVTFYLLIAGIDWLIAWLERTKGFEMTDRFLLMTGLLILLIWVIIWLALFPGLAIYDGPTQLWQFKQGELSTHHPYIHSAFLAFCDYLARLFRFEDYSFFNALLQMLFQWGCYMRILFLMRKFRCRPVFVIYTAVFMALYPPNAFSALTTTKDTIFTGFFILLLCEIAELFCAETFSGAALFRMIFFGTMMSIFRNNGIYVFIAAFPFVLFLRPKLSGRKWAVVYGSVIALTFLYSGFVSHVLHIESGDAREAMSVIIQPLARVYQSVPGELSEEEKGRIRLIFGGNEGVPYVPYCADEPKFLFDSKYFLGDLKNNMALYFALFKRYPTGYMDAWLATNLGNYYPLESLPKPFKVYYEIPLEDKGHSLFPGLYEKIADFAWNSPYRGNAVLTIWLNSGIALWKLLYMMYFIIARRKYDRLVLCLFPFMLMGTMFLGPGTVIRYTQPVTMAIPVIFAAAGNFMVGESKPDRHMQVHA
ncbi:MAG: DUF6020 family protein [Lachnospiraceae bacterium]|nr:DUF6020 family protein [Lachnospiraceae bacterium]